jgi:sugar/nucleoside kinase (ribokinase family)
MGRVRALHALGGAPLNFAAHAKRLGYNPLLISAVGADSLGNAARQEIAGLGLDTSFLQTTADSQPAPRA